MRPILVLLSLSLFLPLISQNNDSILFSQKTLYYDIEMGKYIPNEEKTEVNKNEVPLGFLQPKHMEYENTNITITNDLKEILKSNECEMIKTIRKPSYSARSHRNFKIIAIDIKECSTVLHFKVKVRGNNKFSIPKGSCIFITASKPLFIQAVEGNVPMSKWIKKTSQYKAIFPPIPPDTKKINFKELNKGGNWYTIGLKLD